MKDGPDIRSDSREPVQFNIYLNILYSLVYIFTNDLGPSEVRRRLPTSTTCTVSCLRFQGVSLPVSSVRCVRIYMLTWGVYYIGHACYVMSPQISKVL